jgi:hypothetical protein
MSNLREWMMERNGWRTAALEWFGHVREEGREYEPGTSLLWKGALFVALGRLNNWLGSFTGDCIAKTIPIQFQYKP